MFKFIFIFIFCTQWSHSFAQTVISNTSLSNQIFTRTNYSLNNEQVARLCDQQKGFCFNAQINDQEVTEIKDKNEQQQRLKEARLANINVPEFTWMLKTPVNGEFVFYITKQAKDFAQAILGDEVEEEDVDVFPLQQQNIATQTENDKNLLKEPNLPKGKYVLHLQYIGKFKRDQKFVWLEVE
jgi:hypothetical protein